MEKIEKENELFELGQADRSCCWLVEVAGGGLIDDSDGCNVREREKNA